MVCHYTYHNDIREVKYHFWRLSSLSFPTIMLFFVICGKANCPGFAHAVHVAQYLDEHLPRFEYKRIEKSSDEWEPYVNTLNKRNKWHVNDSPIIWKEISMRGGKKYLLGGLSEFWEYIYCYYGLESSIPRKDVVKLAADNVNFLKEQAHPENLIKMKHEENEMVIAILGVCKQTPILILELLNLKFSHNQRQVTIKLFDTLGNRDTFRSTLMEVLQSDDLYETKRVKIVHNIETALKCCEILIYMYNLSTKTGETECEWLYRVSCRMQLLSGNINNFANRNMRIILNCHGPSCFMASVLLEYCTQLRPSNIVVVTADKGLSMLNILSDITGIRKAQLSAPPVWGFIGINSYIDEKNTVFKSTMNRPYERALTAPRGATLPLGTVKYELRLLSCLLADIDHDYIKREVEQRNEKAKILEYKIGLPKVRALISLLQEWYADNYSDNIISLGIYSDGSFGLPTGIVFSQPVKLNEKGEWVPYAKFPIINDDTQQRISKCATEANKICQNFIISHSHYNSSSGDILWEDQHGDLQLALQNGGFIFDYE